MLYFNVSGDNRHHAFCSAMLGPVTSHARQDGWVQCQPKLESALFSEFQALIESQNGWGLRSTCQKSLRDYGTGSWLASHTSWAGVNYGQWDDSRLTFTTTFLMLAASALPTLSSLGKSARSLHSCDSIGHQCHCECQRKWIGIMWWMGCPDGD